MPKMPKVYTLDDGQTVDYHQVMLRVKGLKKGAAVGRLKATSDPDMVFAEKGQVYGLLYSKGKKKKYNRLPTKEEVVKNDKTHAENFVLANRPFYSDPFYRLALKII
jgi:hypothetical protein